VVDTSTFCSPVRALLEPSTYSGHVYCETITILPLTGPLSLIETLTLSGVSTN